MNLRIDKFSDGEPLQIKGVSRLTNVSIDTIRAWERRYGAISPVRSANGQRMFNTADVERLVLLREAVERGEQISKIGSLTTEQLKTLRQSDSDCGSGVDNVIARLLTRMQTYDISALEDDVLTAALTHPAASFADDVVAPVMNEITQMTRDADERAVKHMLFASALSSSAGGMFAKFAARPHSPALVFVTLPGEKHAIAPLLAAYAAAEAGYSSLFLGTEVAPSQIAFIVRALNAIGVAIFAGVECAGTASMLCDLKIQIRERAMWLGGTAAQALSTGLPVSMTIREFISQLPDPAAVRLQLESQAEYGGARLGVG
ncbi:MAG: MerR family transcriptional regulator [Vulcanimicrobiaceae bacterium]